MASTTTFQPPFSLPSHFPTSLNHPLKLPFYPSSSPSKTTPKLHISSSAAQFLPNPVISPQNNTTLLPFSAEDAQNLYNKCFDLLKLSTRYRDVELTRAVHSIILKLDYDNYLLNCLISAYINLGCLSDAYNVFTKIESPDVVSYSVVFHGLVKFGYEFDGIELFFRMRDRGIDPNEFTFVAFLTACSRIFGLNLGFQVHGLVVKLGYVNSTYVGNSLVSLYCKNECFDDAYQVFDEMPRRDITSWNTVISGAVSELKFDKAFELFRDVVKSDEFLVDNFTFSCLISACTTGCEFSGGGVLGREIHARMLKFGMDNQLSVSNALIAFYTKYGSSNNAEAVFRKMAIKNVISWTSVITAYMEFGMVRKAMDTFHNMPDKNAVTFNAVLTGLCKNNEGLEALFLFEQMVNDGIELTEETLTSVMKACSLVEVKNVSKQLHCFVVKFGVKSNACIEAALLDMCAKCGRIEDAHQLFYQNPYEKNYSIHFTSLICGYARNGQPGEALELFQWGLLEETVNIDEVVLTTVLGICGTLGFTELGEQIHCYVMKVGFFHNVGVGNAVITMYSKCGYLEKARKFFDFLPLHDVVSWNCLISGYLLQKKGDEGLSVWNRMKMTSIKPNSITFLLVISCYRYTKSNMLDDCQKLFSSMKSVYDIEPNSDHYASFVRVFGEYGSLEEAEEIIINMGYEPKGSVWKALLHSCQIHSNSTVGKRIVKRILAIEPKHASTFILKSNLLSASGRWNCAEIVREEMKRKGFQKNPANSWIIHKTKIHSFYTRDKSHSDSKDIYRGLEILILECLKAGYSPDTRYVLHEMEEHQKTSFLYYHSAKLAVTYGLLKTKPGKAVKVVKNVLLCDDCHNFFKHVSKVTKREILLRDTSGFHCFSHGTCSCNDRW